MQDDVFFTKLTVRETLQFTADIRLPDTLSRGEKSAFIDDLLDKFGLTKCQHTRIGDAFTKGISGGERKRLNIANELVHRPSLFLADECTSGLDSSSAMTILKVLKELKDEGRTVVISIHQPSSKMFLMFTKILLLSEGRVAYFGSPHSVVNYFESMDFPFPGVTYNPADYILELVMNKTENVGGKPSVQQQVVDAWRERGLVCYQPHEASSKHEVENVAPGNKHNAQSSIDATSLDIYVGNPPTSQLQRMKRATSKRLGMLTEEEKSIDQKYTSSMWTQIKALAKRSAIEKQGILFQPTTIAQAIITTLLVSACWFRMEPRESRIEDRLGFLFFITVNWGYVSVYSAVFSFPVEKSVLTKDRGNGVYRLSSYYIAKTLVEIPAEVLFPLASSIVIYFVVGQNPDIRALFLFCLFAMLNSLIGQGIGLLSAAVMMNIRQAIILASGITLASFMVSGYMIDINNLPAAVRFTRYLSFFRYSYEGMIRTDFLFGRTYACESDPTQLTIYSQNGRNCPITESALLQAAQLDDIMPIWGYLLVQLAYIVIFRVAGYFALKLLHTNHKPKLSNWGGQ